MNILRDGGSQDIFFQLHSAVARSDFFSISVPYQLITCLILRICASSRKDKRCPTVWLQKLPNFPNQTHSHTLQSQPRLRLRLLLTRSPQRKPFSQSLPQGGKGSMQKL